MVNQLSLSKIPRSKKSAARRPFPSHLFTKSELAKLKNLNTLEKISNHLESMPYDAYDGYRCVKETLGLGKAHCAGGALLAAACLWYHGFEPCLVSLEAEKDDSHFICVYTINGYWGSLSKSNFTTLRSRDPVFKTVRELIMSYWNFYFNLEGYKSLRTFTRPITLSQSDGNTEWLDGIGKDLDWVDEIFEDKKEYSLVPKTQLKYMLTANKSQLNASLLGANYDGLYKGDD